MYRIKKFGIWLFRLKDIKNIIKREREKQIKQDDKDCEIKLEELREKLQNKHGLEITDYEIRLRKKDDELTKLKNREKELDNKEYEIKKLIKEDAYIVEDIHNKTMDIGKLFMKLVGEIGKIKDSAIDLKRRIE